MEGCSCPLKPKGPAHLSGSFVSDQALQRCETEAVPRRAGGVCRPLAPALFCSVSFSLVFTSSLIPAHISTLDFKPPTDTDVP